MSENNNATTEKLSQEQSKGKPSLAGNQYHWLRVIEEVPGYPNSGILWKCECACSNVVEVKRNDLVFHRVRHCGCRTKGRRVSEKHGNWGIPEYWIWRAMLDRCTNDKSLAYKYYGGRGITVHSSWFNSFGTFLKDIGRRPSDKHTLERMDNSRGYEPGNVEWKTRLHQQRNTRRNRLIEYNGETMCL